LFPGWNLITIPIENDWMASDLASNLSGCTLVVKWMPDTQSYWFYAPGYPAFDFPLLPGHGYFVEMDNADNLYLIGNQIIDVNVYLEIGWNLIGWFASENTTASSLCENISGCTLVVKWMPDTQSYWFYAPGYPAFDFPISRGMSVFVEVNEASYWHGEG
jgi:drug/metabolite transporter superfamily protein YnfA